MSNYDFDEIEHKLWKQGQNANEDVVKLFNLVKALRDSHDREIAELRAELDDLEREAKADFESEFEDLNGQITDLEDEIEDLKTRLEEATATPGTCE